jgi:alpha-N-arabinofuranosidase
MERNSDIILMQCYAPLLVNVNPGAWQWRPDLIGYDALSAYGSPSYHAIQMFSRNLGDELLPVQLTDTSVHACATRDSKTGEVFLKLVNPQPNPQHLRLDINGVASLAPKAAVTTLAASPDDTNSIDHPRRVVPVITTLRGLHPSFTYNFPPHSVVVLKLKARR